MLINAIEYRDMASLWRVNQFSVFVIVAVAGSTKWTSCRRTESRGSDTAAEVTFRLHSLFSAFFYMLYYAW